MYTYFIKIFNWDKLSVNINAIKLIKKFKRNIIIKRKYS